MYYEYFGLKEAPFSIAPNPRYLYMSDRHREALAHLLYGIRSDGGFILLTGEVGTGKTTICRCLLEQMPEDVHIAIVLNPKLSAVELLATVCDDLGIEYAEHSSIKIMVDKLNEFLLGAHQEGRRTVLIIDEAQNLATDVLEQLRLLTNLETNQRKLLQIILLGQPELLDMLAQKELRQLSQRITARFHLEALSRGEVHEYIKHRLAIAGTGRDIFPGRTCNRIFNLSGGIPRVINLLCDRCLLGAYSENKLRVNTAVLRKAAREILGHRKNKAMLRQPYTSIAAGIVVLSVFLLFYLRSVQNDTAYMVSSQAELPVEALVKVPVKVPADVYRQQPESITPGSIPVIANLSPLTELGPPVTNSSLNEISEVKGHQSPNLAFKDLFVLWGVVFEDQAPPPCTLALSIGLKCFTSIGSLQDLINLNRPAVISVGQQSITLSQLTDGVATLIAGDRQFEVSAQQFSNHWNGRYTLLWRTPPAFGRPLVLGDVGASVDWLASQLALIGPAPATVSFSQEFDKTLEEQLKQFQSSVDLIPDGVAGARTFIHVNNIQAAGIPFLNVREG